jgi:hypothetical protein
VQHQRRAVLLERVDPDFLAAAMKTTCPGQDNAICPAASQSCAGNSGGPVLILAPSSFLSLAPSLL